MNSIQIQEQNYYKFSCLNFPTYIPGVSNAAWEGSMESIRHGREFTTRHHMLALHTWSPVSIVLLSYISHDSLLLVFELHIFSRSNNFLYFRDIKVSISTIEIYNILGRKYLDHLKCHSVLITVVEDSQGKTHAVEILLVIVELVDIPTILFAWDSSGSVTKNTQPCEILTERLAKIKTKLTTNWMYLYHHARKDFLVALDEEESGDMFGAVRNSTSNNIHYVVGGWWCAVRRYATHL